MLVGDREVVEIMLRKLLEPVYKSGAVVDGFPRTKVKVECVKMLYQKLLELHNKFKETLFAEHFQPHFHIVDIVDEKESVKRQLNREREAMIRNAEVLETGVGNMIELRPTDLDPNAALNRYRTFKEKTYGALKDLREIFYHFINAHGPVEVRQRIDEELRYQGSLELDEATYDRVSRVPVAATLSKHARQELVDRLDTYADRRPDLFDQVVSSHGRVHADHRAPRDLGPCGGQHREPDHAGLGRARDDDRYLLGAGYHATVDIRREAVPDSIAPKSFKIKTRVTRVYRVRVYFKGSDIRRGR